MRQQRDPSWDQIREMAAQLEFRVEDASLLGKANGVRISKYQGDTGWFADTLAGRLAAQEWLESERAVWEAQEQWQRDHPREGSRPRSLWQRVLRPRRRNGTPRTRGARS